MKAHLIIVLMTVLLFPFLICATTPKVPSKVIYDITDVSSCLDYQGYNRSGMGFTLHFKNRCDFNVYAIACVTYPNGAKEINKSSSRIPERGRWNMTFFDGFSPKSVDWSAAMYPTQLPPSCT